MILAVDIGGTKTLISLFDDNQRILKQHKMPTTSEYSSFLDTLRQVIEKDFWQSSIQAIGIAVPGFIDYKNGRILRLGNLNWHGAHLRQELEDIFHVPVAIENDANIAGFAEVLNLTNAPSNVVYITIGTGIGSGIITDRQINPYFAHSEAGHIMLLHEGKLQRWEDIASGRAIVQQYKQEASEITDQRIWQEIANKLALGFFALIPLLQPEIVIVGGGVGTHFEHYREFLQQELQAGLPPIVPMPIFAQAKRPEEAVVYGCYELAKRALA